MAVTLNSSQVQQNFGATLDRALRGDDVIVVRYGAPRAALVEYERYQKLVVAEQAQGEAPAARPEAAAFSHEEQLKEGVSPYLLKSSPTPAQGLTANHRAHASSTGAENWHVVTTPGVCDGQPIIRGTRILVRAIIGYHKLGLGVDEILDGLPHLAPAQLYAALSYYYDHQDEIELEIRESQQEPLMARYGLQIASDGRVTIAS